MESHYTDFDLSKFWEGSEYEKQEYISEPLSDLKIEQIENQLGYKLPAAYKELMKYQNGGVPLNKCSPTNEATSWAEDHAMISGILGIASEKRCTIGGEFGSQFMIEEWGYPDIGVYFGDCPSSGHDMICLDYRELGPDGEPCVVHVDQESDFAITKLADNFESFVKGLVHESEFDDGEDW